eukprot:gene20980-16140_t
MGQGRGHHTSGRQVVASDARPTAAQPSPPCRFYNSPKGCARGVTCFY